MKPVQHSLNPEVRELTALERAAVSGGYTHMEEVMFTLKTAPPTLPGILSADHNI